MLNEQIIMLRAEQIERLSDAELDAQLARVRSLITGSRGSRVTQLRKYEKRLLKIAAERDLLKLAADFQARGRDQIADICLRERQKRLRARGVVGL